MPKISNITERENYAIWRNRNRVRQTDIAKYCGCSIATISRWENSIIDVSDDILEKYNDYIVLFDNGKIRAING